MEEKNNCAWGSCPGVYEVRSLDCGAGPCPTVYEIRNNCTISACPAVYAEEHKDNYLVIGRQLSPEEIGKLGVEKKVGPGETMIAVPKSLLENL